MVFLGVHYFNPVKITRPKLRTTFVGTVLTEPKCVFHATLKWKAEYSPMA